LIERSSAITEDRPSEVKLNIIDAERAIHGTLHGSVADAVVAALSAKRGQGVRR
jgi:hypothetical protein